MCALVVGVIHTMVILFLMPEGTPSWLAIGFSVFCCALYVAGCIVNQFKQERYEELEDTVSKLEKEIKKLQSEVDDGK
jgi:cell division protein FtsB